MEQQFRVERLPTVMWMQTRWIELHTCSNQAQFLPARSITPCGRRRGFARTLERLGSDGVLVIKEIYDRAYFYGSGPDVVFVCFAGATASASAQLR